MPLPHRVDTGQESVLAGVERLLVNRGARSDRSSHERISATLHALGDPHRTLRAVHLTGTNGKTTTALLVDALLRSAGLSTGRFTSPHLVDLTERIVVDNVPVSAATVLARHGLVSAASRAARGTDDLSFFEALVAIAYSHFADKGIDAAVIEVGIGGRHDSTNVLDGEVAVFTPIDLDHQEFLGGTVAAIATEKSGILKSGGIAVTATQHPDARRALAHRAGEVGASLLCEDADFRWLVVDMIDDGQVISVQTPAGSHRRVRLHLHGQHQAQNAACAIVAAESFLGRALTHDEVSSAFAAARSPGRLEQVCADPPTLIDVAHNPHGMAASLRELRRLRPGTEWAVVLAVAADKDVPHLAGLVADLASTTFATGNGAPRSMGGAALAQLLLDHVPGAHVQTHPDVEGAVMAAQRWARRRRGAGRGAAVLVTGSTITAGRARLLLTRQRP